MTGHFFVFFRPACENEKRVMLLGFLTYTKCSTKSSKNVRVTMKRIDVFTGSRTRGIPCYEVLTKTIRREFKRQRRRERASE